jgi:spore maturation protein CgeB
MMQKNKIAIVGVLDKETSSNIWMASSFRRRNFDIIPINYRTLIKEYGESFFYSYTKSRLQKHRPILTVFCKCNGINLNIIAECNKYTQTWLWFMDSYKIAEAAPEIVEHAKNSHYSSCTSQVTVDYFRSKGVNNCHHVYEGIDINVHKPVSPVEEYKADISFVGSRTKERDDYFNLLKSNGYDVKFYGNGYSNPIPLNDWAKVCASSKFMLSLNTFNDIPNYFSGRVFETLGCGACTFHLDQTHTINSIFRDGEEIVLFKDKTELLDKLSKMDASIAKRIAINGREKVLKNFTMDHSINNILKIVFGK